ncbi:MAG: SUF system Fe-S cluster assembly protein [Anaerolineae bacterium]|nr:SUF system Fe-S cluster assembly protein [Phycisphaerae bacterium]
MSDAPTIAKKNLADRTPIDRVLDSTRTPQQKAVEEKVIEVLKTVFDPELPVNIYELGLIYEINVAEDNSVHVKMTLTAPACPVAGSLPPEVERKIETIDEVPRAKVEVVWDPPWTKDRMSEAALLELGLL